MTRSEEDLSLPSHERGRAAIVAATIAFIALAIAPLRIVGVGFRPPDDALRHAAKAISGKPWTEILVLRPEATVDPHPGWHAVLAALHRAGIESPTGLVILSSVALATLFLLLPLWIGRGPPEAWLLALLVTAIAGWGFFFRLMLGRPFDFTLSALLALVLLWPRLRGDRLARGVWTVVAGLVALATWIHGNWYLWALPLACFALAREVRIAARLTVAVGIGVLGGAIATGRPLAFLGQTLSHPFWALGGELPASLLVSEFRPSDGTPAMVAVIVGFVLWRHLRGCSLAPLLRDPVLLLAGASWALGFHIMRFWWDWGVPAVLVWMTNELAEGLPIARLRVRSRVLLTATLATVLVLAVTADYKLRWSRTERSTYLDGRNPRHRPWLPDPGGVLYSNSMKVFYDTFFRNPNAPWRYALGFEPTLMHPDDLAVYRAIHRRGASDASFAPWIARLRPADRLVVVRRSAEKPRIEKLDWYSPYRGMWIGRRRDAPSADDGAANGALDELGAAEEEPFFDEPPQGGE